MSKRPLTDQEFNRLAKLRKRNLTPEQFEGMILEQRGCCWICGERMDRPCIDHDHKTGQTRGLLCAPCNAGLGMFKDSPRLLAQAIVYLEEFASLDDE